MLRDKEGSPESKQKLNNNHPHRRSDSHSSSSSKQSVGSHSSKNAKQAAEDQSGSKTGKLFISYLDANQSAKASAQQIRQLLGKKYELQCVEVKKSRNGYSYAFVDVKEIDKIDDIIAEFNNFKLNGKRIVVERKRIFGERPPKRNNNCYSCGKEGHIARQCNGRNRSSSEEKNIKSSKRHRRVSSSESCERDRNKSKKRRYRTRDKKQDKKKDKKKNEDSDNSSSDSSSSSESVSSSSSSQSQVRKRRAKKRQRREKHKKKHVKRKGKGKSKKESSESS